MRQKKFIPVQNIILLDEDNEDALNDVIIENKQALEMVEMHRNILESMMNAFASMISNNLNNVMKFLTSVTIVFTIPTLIASYWGMNVPVPYANTPYAFIAVILFSICITAIISVFLFRRGMF